MADTKTLFTQRIEAARTAWTEGNEPAAAEALRWAIRAARSDPSLRRELAAALFNLGKLSRKFGRPGEAEAGQLLTEALALSEELVGRDNAALAPVLLELSRLYVQQSQYAPAQDVLERLLAIARVKGADHPDVAAALSDLAFVKRKLGDDASAEALYRDALRIQEKVLEPNHTVTVGTLERLSETCAARGNFAEALALLHRALPAREAALGAGHERVLAARSRAAKLESQIATASSAPAPVAAAARPPKDAEPTSPSLKRAPDSPADTPSTHAPSPIHSREPEFIGASEPRALRPAPRPRERSKTPAVTAAVAAASLMASSIQTSSASQIVPSQPESAHSPGSVTGRGSYAALRDGVLAGVVYGDVASADVPRGDAALGDWRSSVALTQGDSPEPPRKKRTVLYASAGVTAATIALAGLLMLRPHAASGKGPGSKETSPAQRTAAAVVPVTVPAAGSASMRTGAAAIMAAMHADSLRAANVTTAPSAVATQREQHAPESARPELRAPRVVVRLDSVNLPSMPETPSVDAILHSAMDRRSASDTDRTGAKDEVSHRTSADVDYAHTSPRIMGSAPQPAFPDALLRSGTRDGQVVVRFIVNELGKVDLASVIVERSDDELFTAAVREVLPRFHFEPAHTLGQDSKPVAAWVSVPFRFTTKKKK